MAIVILQRHGRTTANASGLLAGRTPGVRLDGTGEEQAAAAAARLAAVPLQLIVTSPQERCHQTAAYVARSRPDIHVEVDAALDECDYGEWQGRALRELATEDLWKVVQRQPSAAVFPGGESIPAMQHRAVTAIRARDRTIEVQAGPQAVWLAVTHGDIITSVLADALGMHLDLYQRLNADPASLTVIRYGPDRPRVLQANTHAGALDWLVPPAPQAGDAAEAAEAAGENHTADGSGDAVLGGGSGPSRPHP